MAPQDGRETKRPMENLSIEAEHSTRDRMPSESGISSESFIWGSNAGGGKRLQRKSHCGEGRGACPKETGRNLQLLETSERGRLVVEYLKNGEDVGDFHQIMDFLIQVQEFQLPLLVG